MSYIRAGEVLPKELIKTIQQYVNGKALWKNNQLKIVPEKPKSQGFSYIRLSSYFSTNPKSIYISCREKKDWGSQTNTKQYYETRNHKRV